MWLGYVIMAFIVKLSYSTMYLTLVFSRRTLSSELSSLPPRTMERCSSGANNTRTPRHPSLAALGRRCSTSLYTPLQ